MDEELERQQRIEEERATFWNSAYVPVDEDWKENGTEFVNPVVVADMFATSTGTAAKLAQEAEVISEKLAKLDYEKGRLARQVAKIRRTIFADHYNKITKSAGAEIQDAFILSMADEGQKALLLSLEEDIEDRLDKIGRLTPRLERVRYRLKVLERNMDWAKQYLDHEKLQMRIFEAGRR